MFEFGAQLELFKTPAYTGFKVAIEGGTVLAWSLLELQLRAQSARPKGKLPGCWQGATLPVWLWPTSKLSSLGGTF
jgi:hypothetical protein